MYTEKDLIAVAGRENNKKRNYLIVNKLQAKHIPVNPEKTLEERIAGRDTQSDILFRKGVFERDNYTCIITKQVGGDLVAHHLDGYDWCIDKRYDVSNGVTLSKQIHAQFHKKYGFGKNTKKQFDEFCKSYKNNYGNTEVTS